MNCLEFEQLLDRHLDGELTGSFKLEFEAHVVDCEPCGHLLAMMQAVGQIVADEDPDEPMLDERFTDRLLVDIDQIQSRRNRWRGILSATAAAAALMLIISLLVRFAGPQGPAAVLAGADDTPDTVAMIKPIIESDPSLTPVVTEQPKTVVATVSDVATELSDPKPIIEPPSTNIIVASDQDHADDQLQQWVVSTIEQAGLTIHQVRQLREVAFDQFREALIRHIAARQMPSDRMIPESVFPAPSLDPSLIPAEHLLTEDLNGYI